MSAAGIGEIIAFTLSAFTAIAGALGMATTMSMFRSAVFLMASFMGVAGLFILLSADLLGFLQIMMYIGGMLVMALFMVLFMPDPGGAMMASMPGLTLIERLFSRGLAQNNPNSGEPEEGGGDAGHDTHAAREGGHDMAHMDMSDMSMVTPVRTWAVGLAVATGCVLVGLLILRPSWRVSSAVPDPRSAEEVGSLLMDKYMVGFEGAGFLILIGIFGAVLAAHSRQHPDRRDRKARVAVNAPPPAIESDLLEPLAQSRQDGDRCSPDPNGSHAQHAGGPKGPT
jgi:NADH-quinone oxidoreductase subunit J